MDHKYLCILFITYFVAKSSSVNIKELRVPEMIQKGVIKDVILDCDYEIDKHKKDGLVVKWFFDETQVYQWIVGRAPQDLGILRGRLNLDYKASKDPEKVHRALYITDIDQSLSGIYKCVVSTFADEKELSKKMTVFVKETDFNFEYEPVDEGNLRVTCSAEAIFPKPNITIYDADRPVFEYQVENVTMRDDGLFDIETSVTIEPDNLEETFVCEMNIPDANYTIRKEVFYSDSCNIFKYFKSWLLILPALLLL